MARPRLPDQVKKAKGTFRESRANPQAPEFPVAAPERPTWLSPYAAEEWDRLIPVLLAARVLAAVDLGVAAAYCTAVAELRIANEVLAKADHFYTSATGHLREHPAAKASRELGTKVLRLAVDLGLTPAARARVNAVPPDLPAGAPDLENLRAAFFDQPAKKIVRIIVQVHVHELVLVRGCDLVEELDR